MKSITFILLMATTLSLSAKEVAKPKFDNREWVLGWSIEQDHKTLPKDMVFQEYVLKGETVQNWSELVTIQFFPELQISIEFFEQSNKMKILNACSNAKWQTLSSNDNERVWEWNIKNCMGQPDQSEIARAIKTKEGIHFFHYVVKKANFSGEDRKLWLNNLNSIKIENE